MQKIYLKLIIFVSIILTLATLVFAENTKLS